jgi:hypothetical protein
VRIFLGGGFVMNRRTALGLVLGQLVLLGCGDDTSGSGGAGGDGGSGGDASTTTTTTTTGTQGGAGEGGAGGAAQSQLSQAEIDSLYFMREEEKLARDVYMALDQYGNPFANIKNSEQSHMDAVLALLTAYGLDDPAAGKAPGEFVNTALDALYEALVAKGLPTQIAALRVGCEIEELDIRDIEAAKADIDHADILATYDSLLKGSRNHLRAYYGKLVDVGGTYTPQYIEQATFDAIVSSPKE